VAKKRGLPLLDEVSARARDAGASANGAKPTLEAARRRLGGSARDDAPPPAGMGPGAIVGVAGRGAVVVFARPDEVHVMIDARSLKKLAPGELTPLTSAIDAALEPIAADARVFGALGEGQWVRYADEGGNAREGKLVEKCRYGALVARGDGVIVAVGFRKLWPVTAAGNA
jgi:hypothetical protein